MHDFPPASEPTYSPNRFERGGGYMDVDGTDAEGTGAVQRDIAPGESKYGFGRGQESGLGAAEELGLWDDNYGGDLTRGAYVRHPEDDDFSQAGDLVRNVMDDAARDRLATNIVDAMAGVSDQVAQQAFNYWTHVDEWLGAEVEKRFTASKQ